MTTNQGSEPQFTDWRRRWESLPARWRMSGGVLAVMLVGALWLVFDNVALGIALGVAFAVSFGWWGGGETGNRPDRRAAGGPDVPDQPGR